jgi:hypothetical protein
MLWERHEQVLAHAEKEQPGQHHAVASGIERNAGNAKPAQQVGQGGQAARAHEVEQRRDEHHQEAGHLARQLQQAALEIADGVGFVEKVVEDRGNRALRECVQSRRDHEQDEVTRQPEKAHPEAGRGTAGFGRRDRAVGQGAAL